MLKKVKKSDREQKLLEDSGNLMMCRKSFSMNDITNWKLIERRLC